MLENAPTRRKFVGFWHSLWFLKVGLATRRRRPLKTLANLLKNAALVCTADTSIEVWFQDEARVGQTGTHAYVRAPIGSRPLMVRDNRHASASLFGAICPSHAVGAATIIMPGVNTGAMNEHLQEIGTQVAADTS